MLTCFAEKNIKLASRLTFSTALLGLMLANPSYAMDKLDDGKKKPPISRSKRRSAPKSAKSLEQIEPVSRPYSVPAFIQPVHDPAKGYPTVPPWGNFSNAPDDFIHFSMAQKQNFQQNLEKGHELRAKRDFYCSHYFEAVINDSKAPSMLRDQAILERAQVLLEILPNISKIRTPESIKKTVWKDNLICLHFLADKESTSKYQKGSIFYTLADYYNPLRGSLCPQPKNVEYFAHEALKYEFNPEHKAILLDDVAKLYQYRHLGTGENCVHKACEYYDLAIQNHALPIKYRFHARVDKINTLFESNDWQNKTIEEQKESAKLVMDEAKDFPELQKKAKLYHARLMFKEYDLAQSDQCNILERTYVAFKELYQDVSLLDDAHIQFLKLCFAQCLYNRTFHYNVVDSDTLALNRVLAELIHQKKPPSKHHWQQAVIMATKIMSDGAMPPSFLGKQNPGELLNSILQDPSALSSDKNTAKAVKTVLVAKGLVPKAMNHEDLNDLNDALKSADLSKRVKLMVLTTLVQKTQKCFPHYNNQIKELVNYLKEALLEETDPIDQKKILFILYTYFQAYKECPITAEEAAEYVQDLSSEDTPEAFRIHLTTDEDSDGEIEPHASGEGEESAEIKSQIVMGDSLQTTHPLLPAIALASLEGIATNSTQVLPSVEGAPQESVETKTAMGEQGPILEIPKSLVESNPSEESIDLQPWLQYKKSSTKDVDPDDGNLTSEPTEASDIPSENVEPLLSVDPQQARNIHHAQLLLERLEESRGKIDQSEVANMLRRLDYTFQPTADNGLTLHLGHKGRKNKKGTPGRLDGGRKSDLAAVLRDAITQAKNTND